jgi:protein-S-isoprenylcysteine O-methyltransferase Ste14
LIGSPIASWNVNDLAAPRHGQNMIALERFIKARRILLTRLLVVPLVAAILLSTSAWKEHVVVEGALFLAGCVLVGVATIGRLWCSVYICGYKTKSLVTTGPYSLCRNPLYFFSAIGAIGVGLTTETFTLPLVLAVLFAIFYPLVIRAEEANLEKVHGAAYRDYASAVPRFWPRTLRVREADQYLVVPAKFRKAMFDAVWFIWLVGLVQLVEELHDAGVLHAVVRLY